MKILMISYNEIGRGTYLRAFELARGLVKLGQSVTILASTHNEQIEETTQSGVRVFGIPSRILRAGWDPHNIIGRLKWIKNNNDFDIVHGFESRPAVIFPALRLVKKSIPLVLDWCDLFGKGGSVEERPNFLIRTGLRPFETFFENNYRTKANGTTVICNTLYEHAINQGVNPETIQILYNGFNIPNWQPIPKPIARSFFHLTDQDFVIGYIGSLFPRDAELMEKAFTRTIDLVPNAKLLHLGKTNYRVRSDDLPHQTIISTGTIDELTLMRGLSACDIFWLPLSDIPANWGRFPLKFSNYLTAGGPILVTAVGDPPKIVERNGVGKVCQATPESIAFLTGELAGNPSIREEMSKAAAKLSQDKNQSWEARSKTLLELYHRVYSNYDK